MSSLHYVHNTLSLPEDNGFQHCSWPCWHPLIFACYCDRVGRVLVGFCSKCTVYQRTGFSTAAGHAGTLYNIRVQGFSRVLFIDDQLSASNRNKENPV